VARFRRHLAAAPPAAPAADADPATASERSLIDEELACAPPPASSWVTVEAAPSPTLAGFVEPDHGGLMHAAEVVSHFDAASEVSAAGPEDAEVRVAAPPAAPASAWAADGPMSWGAPADAPAPEAPPMQLLGGLPFDTPATPPNAPLTLKTAPLPPMPSAVVEALGVEGRYAPPPSMAVEAIQTIPLAPASDMEVMTVGEDNTAVVARKAAAGGVPVVDRRLAAVPAMPEKWGLKKGAFTREDLDLGAIRGMVRAGDVTADDLIRRPGGEWMRAGDFGPLRASFQPEAPTATMRAARVEPRPGGARRSGGSPLRLGAAVLAGSFLAGVAWWLVALTADAEVPFVAAAGGIATGLLARRVVGSGPRAAIGGALGSPLSVLWGKYLIVKMVQSGVASGGLAGATSLASALTTGMATLSIGCLAAGCVVGFLAGILRS
jgi:hypothetical protein